MTYSAARLTLYALLSAVETDLREVLIVHSPAEKSVRELLGEDLYGRTLNRYLKDEGAPSGGHSITDLVDYLDFADAFQVLNANKAILPTQIGNILSVATPLLERLIPIRNRVAHSRPLDFEDFDLVLEIVGELQTLSSTFWKNLNYSKQRILANPGIVLDQTLPSAPQGKTTHNLPIPDFDETGFLGRADQVSQLSKLIFGPYPVLSLIGEGGLGKTALALKVAYEILDRSDCPFEGIVWTSAKSATITAQEIVRIEGAITDSLGILSSVAASLSGAVSEDPIEDIIEYLTEFKLLLILDNLETVIDNRIIGFLERLPHGSKVLITSRIGLGEFERRLKLGPLESKEAMSLLRSLIRLRGVESLKNANQEHLKRLCNKMQNNPGYIKWFVAAVQAGTRPEQILDQPKLFLDFCLTNVYQYLESDSKWIVKSMQSIAGNLSQAEIAVLTEIDVLNLQRAIHQLLSTNMVVMKSVAMGKQSETKYGLSDLARDYLQRHHPVTPDEYRTFQARQKQISQAHLFLENELSRNRFSIYSIVTRSKGDVIVAKYLIDALRAAQRKDYQDAQRLVSLARGLAPHNHEVHRVEAWVQASSGNIVAAEDSYEVAVELEPDSAPLRMLYGGFLSRYVHDNARAMTHYNEAMRLAPGEMHVKAETARLHIFMDQYSEASALLDQIVAAGTIPAWLNRKVCDLRLQIHQRQADGALHQHDPVSALAHLEQLVERYEAMPSESRDSHIANTVHRAYLAIGRCSKFSGDAITREAVSRIEIFLEKALTDLGRLFTENASERGQRQALVCRVLTGKHAAFIREEDGGEFYLNFNQVKNYSEDRPPEVGDDIIFYLGQNQLGPCAVNCIHIPNSDRL